MGKGHGTSLQISRASTAAARSLVPCDSTSVPTSPSSATVASMAVVLIAPPPARSSVLRQVLPCGADFRPVAAVAHHRDELLVIVLGLRFIAKLLRRLRRTRVVLEAVRLLELGCLEGG